MDSPWDENPDESNVREVEWAKISSEFSNVGYREGIIAGKEAASQEGFDIGYATVGVPIGRELGILRGISSVLLAFLKDAADMGVQEKENLVAEARDISSQLSKVRFSDIMPRDLEAEQHAREHLEAEGETLVENEQIAAKRDIEGLEDMLANLGSAKEARPTVEDVHSLKSRLEVLSIRLGLNVNWT
ncbi:hypothetical protein D9613_003930 [Agrocybe pediades]|uniref:Protein YAE1 n=1 Tax=Agrocybe pediades TaxID=84607 RepID=A0A8H4QK24_9AGAR|nr:hypothetical protein D9613_003930 [Agrocybe pediades]